MTNEEEKKVNEEMSLGDQITFWLKKMQIISDEEEVCQQNMPFSLTPNQIDVQNCFGMCTALSHGVGFSLSHPTSPINLADPRNPISSLYHSPSSRIRH